MDQKSPISNTLLFVIVQGHCLINQGQGHYYDDININHIGLLRVTCTRGRFRPSAFWCLRD